MMGYDWSKDLVHVPYGLVSLKGGKLSTRKGNVIYAEEMCIRDRRCLYNGFLAQQNSVTGMPTYFLPLKQGSKKKWASKTHDFW